MRAVVQRVNHASVRVDGEIVGAIGSGLMVLLGAGRGDDQRDVDYMVRKVVGLRVFEDDDGRMNLSVDEVAGEVLVVSQFTLFGDCRKGRRPSFVSALDPDEATLLVDGFVAGVRARGLTVATGAFGAHMDVELLNRGPVTILIDSRKEF